MKFVSELVLQLVKNAPWLFASALLYAHLKIHFSCFELELIKESIANLHF